MPRSWILAASLLVVASLTIPPSHASPSGPVPHLLVSVDVPSLLVNDSWDYDSHIRSESTQDTSDIFLNMTFTMSERVVVSQDARTYDVYNMTVNGIGTGYGSIVVPPIGSFPYTITTATVGGYVWMERGDLARVRDNQTIVATGTVQTPCGAGTLLLRGAQMSLYTPSQEDYDFPIDVGDAWTSNVSVRNVGYLAISVNAPTVLCDVADTQFFDETSWLDLSGQVVGPEDATVPAGTFEAMHVSWSGTAAMEQWFAPAAKTFVRLELHDVFSATHNRHVWTNMTDVRLAGVNLPLSVTLVPDRTGPGGPVTVQGSTEPNLSLRVLVPSTGLVVPLVADDGGTYAVIVSAPTFDDFTPTATDAGSHGILVETSDAVRFNQASATVTLDRPDLAVVGLATEPGSPVLNGSAVVVNATVAAGLDAGVYGPIRVAFVATDIDLDRDGVPDQALSAYCSAGLCIGTDTIPALDPGGRSNASVAWTASYGVAAVSAFVDPDDDYKETDEGNNIRAVSVDVSGPDLTPWAITVDGLTSWSYPDPSAVAFLSDPIPAVVGGSVVLQLRVRNSGAFDAPSSILRVQNTSGLRGPPLGPPLSEIPVPPIPAGGTSGVMGVTWPAPGVAGDVYVNVTVDARSEFDEPSEANNTFVVHVQVGTFPDLVPTSLSVSASKATVAAEVVLRVRVQNVGPEPADVSTVRVVAVDDPATDLLVAAVPALLPQETSSTYSVIVSSSSAGVRTFRVRVDADGQVTELNESNNDATADVDFRGPPVTTLVVGGPRYDAPPAVYVSPATKFTLNVTDRSDEGLDGTWYRLDGGSPTPYALPFRVTGEGPHTLVFNSSDNLGGVEPENTFAFVVDATPPETNGTVEVAGEVRTVRLTATDTGSGVASLEYRLDGGSRTAYVGPIAVTGVGFHTVQYYASDRVGNVAEMREAAFEISAPPRDLGTALNLKPILAIAFAVALVVVGLLLGLRGRSFRLSVGLAAIELGTGVASLSVAELRVPDGSLGLAADVGILVGGLIATYVVWRRVPEGPAEVGPE